MLLLGRNSSSRNVVVALSQVNFFAFQVKLQTVLSLTKFHYILVVGWPDMYWSTLVYILIFINLLIHVLK